MCLMKSSRKKSTIFNSDGRTFVSFWAYLIQLLKAYCSHELDIKIIGKDTTRDGSYGPSTPEYYMSTEAVDPAMLFGNFISRTPCQMISQLPPCCCPPDHA